MYTNLMRRAGLTMIELLVVIVLVALLIILAMFGVQRYLTLAQDAERKSDLQEYRTALEEYFTDNQVYPTAATLLDCGGDGLAPYMAQIKCDPANKTTPYLYVPNATHTDYVLYAQLVNDTDPIIAQYNCEEGCGPDHDGDGTGDFNLGVSDEGPITGEGRQSLPPPGGGQPTPKPPSGCGSWCYANQCTTCCGPYYRCSADGTTCMPDNSCNPCPNGVCL